jgi:hypothetical protein
MLDRFEYVAGIHDEMKLSERVNDRLVKLGMVLQQDALTVAGTSNDAATMSRTLCGRG